MNTHLSVLWWKTEIGPTNNCLMPTQKKEGLTQPNLNTWQHSAQLYDSNCVHKHLSHVLLRMNTDTDRHVSQYTLQYAWCHWTLNFTYLLFPAHCKCKPSLEATSFPNSRHVSLPDTRFDTRYQLRHGDNDTNLRVCRAYLLYISLAAARC